MFLQRFPVRFPYVDIEADLRHVIREKLLDLRFVPGHAGNGDHLLQKRDRFFATVVDLLHKCLVDTRTHLRSPKNRWAGASLSSDFTSVNPRPSTSSPSSAKPPAMNFTLACRRRSVAIAAGKIFHDRPRSAMALTMRCGVIGDTS